jgi:hypothetical protein
LLRKKRGREAAQFSPFSPHEKIELPFPRLRRPGKLVPQADKTALHAA